MTSTMLNSENPYFNCNIKNVCDVCAVCIRTLQTNEFPLDKVISEQTMYIEKKVYEILEAFSNFKLHDNGPQYLCATCYKNTVSVYKFQQLCNKTYALFLEYSMYNDNILEGSIISEDQIENKLNTEVIEIKNDEKHETKVVTATSKRKRRQRPKFKCPVCHKIITGWNIKIHMRVHTGEKPYKCTHCDAAFSQSFTLNIHIKRHENIKTCICTFCGKGFVDKSGLKQHEETHSELKSYKCQQCEKSFNTKRALLSHNIVHAKDKRFTCEYCAKSYPRKKTLVLHLRSHTGEKPHLCTKCGKSFTQMHSLRSHLQRHQRDSMDRALKYTEECEIATS